MLSYIQKTSKTRPSEILRVDQFSPRVPTCQIYDSIKRGEHFREFQSVYRDVLVKEAYPQKEKCYNLNPTTFNSTPKKDLMKLNLKSNKEEVKMVRIDVPTFGLEKAVLDNKAKVAVPRKSSDPLIFKQRAHFQKNAFSRVVPAYSKKEIQAKFSTKSVGEQIDLFKEVNIDNRGTNKQRGKQQRRPTTPRTPIWQRSRKSLSERGRRISKSVASHSKLESLTNIKMKYRSIDDYFDQFNSRSSIDCRTSQTTDISTKDSTPPGIDILMKTKFWNESPSFNNSKENVRKINQDSKTLLKIYEELSRSIEEHSETEKKEQKQIKFKAKDMGDCYKPTDDFDSYHNIIQKFERRTKQNNFEKRYKNEIRSLEPEYAEDDFNTLETKSDKLMSTLHSIKQDLESIAQPPELSSKETDVKFTKFTDTGKFFGGKKGKVTPSEETIKKIDEITKSMYDVDKLCRDIDDIQSSSQMYTKWMEETTKVDSCETFDDYITKSAFLAKEFNVTPKNDAPNTELFKDVNLANSYPELMKRFSM